MPRYDFWALNSKDDQLALLKKHTFFNDCLLPDILNGSVFPAIRQRNIDFYYLGRKLCTYANGTFRTNIAYLAAFQNRPKGEVTESAFSRLLVCRSFSDGYSQIKSNIGLYTQPESREVSRLCKDHSCFKRPHSRPIVVLDIELSLKAVDEGRSQDRIDLVLFHLNEKRLRFVEVKTFDNKEIWPNPDGDVKVVGQIARYKRQLERNHEELTRSYRQYVCLLPDLFGIRPPEPQAVDKDVDLLVTGFDTTQLQTLKAKLLPAFGEAFRTNHRGSLARASQGTLAEWWNNKKVS
jgi:hypothetical protein